MRLAGAEVVARRRVPGGDINEAERVELADGRVLFVKSRRDPPRGFYAAEAAGLRWLAKADALPLPAVEAVDDAFLALRWVDSAPRAADFDERLGRGLALLHRAGAPRCGTPGPTFLGPLELPNEPLPWPQFYAQQRLAPLAARAGVREVAAVIERIDGLAGPPEPLARLHGDLWSGNVIAGPDGGPWLVDPSSTRSRRRNTAPPRADSSSSATSRPRRSAVQSIAAS